MNVVHIRCTNTKKITVPLDASKTVLEFKESIVNEVEIPVDSQRLIYKGRILKDDQTLSSYGVEPDTTIHIVRGGKVSASNPPSQAQRESNIQTSAIPTRNIEVETGSVPGLFGAGVNQNMSRIQQQLLSNPEMMSNLMNNPIMQNMLNDPSILQNVMASNPQMRQLLESNPQLAHIFNDPAIMRQSLEMMRNPAAMREAMRSQDLAMSNLETHPEGFNALRRMYTEVQEPMMEAMANNERQSNSSNTTQHPQDVPSSTAMPNPWAPSQVQSSSFNGTSSQPPNTPSTNISSPFLGGTGTSNSMNMPDSELLDLLRDPFMQSMMQQALSNPAAVENMISTNPSLRAMVDANPSIREQLPNIISGMSNPENLQAMIQMQQSMAQLQRNGLLPPIRGLSGNPNQMQGLDFSSLFGATPAPTVNNPRETYSRQLRQLSDMGFVDEEANIRALLQTQGNVNAAVERLLSGV